MWPFQVAHQGYLHLRTDRPSLNEIASGARAIGIPTPEMLKENVAKVYKSSRGGGEKNSSVFPMVKEAPSGALVTNCWSRLVKAVLRPSKKIFVFQVTL